MRRVLVTGAGGSAASNFVQALRLADEPYALVGADAVPYHLELAEVDARYLLPHVDEPGYLDALNRLIERERIELVHAQPDDEVEFLGRHRQEIAARTLLPADATIALCRDKGHLAEALRAAGLPSAAFATVDSRADLESETDAILAEHGRAWVRVRHGAGARAALPVSSGEQAAAWAAWWIAEKGLAWKDFLVSQFLPGREFAFQGLWHDGRLVTSQARERLAYLLGHLVPSGQTSTPSVARTVNREDVNDPSIRAVEAIDPRATGVFGVDLKEDTAGRPLITEINAGRFFTTINFFAAAGLNMPDAYVRLALGDRLPDLPRTDALEEGLYWVRMVDMGFRLVRPDGWSARPA